MGITGHEKDKTRFNVSLVFISEMLRIKGHFLVSKLDALLLMALSVGFNWLLIGTNTHHYFSHTG